jgi:hypothetical protein
MADFFHGKLPRFRGQFRVCSFELSLMFLDKRFNRRLNRQIFRPNANISCYGTSDFFAHGAMSDDGIGFGPNALWV